MAVDGTWLGIDIGTSGVKSVLIDAAQEVIGRAGAPLTVSRPHPGWSEQDPEDWWRAVVTTVDALAKAHPGEVKALRGIGLSGQQHGATLLDAGDRVLRPCILWNDGRSTAECIALEDRADFRGITGNLLMPGTTAPKLEWVRAHEPETFAKVAKVLLPKDYVRLRLTGEHLSDMSDSAGTLWMDVGARDWSAQLLEASHLSTAHMPGLVEGSDPAGTLRAELADHWGIVGMPVVAGGGGDNASSACGVGAVAPGTGFLSIGTSGVLFVSTGGFAPNSQKAVHAFCHALPGLWHQMGVVLSAADSLVWLGRMTGKSPVELSEGIDPATAPAAPLAFLPYLSGERTPYNDAEARGAFVGLSQANDLKDLSRAVLEGVAYAFVDSFDALWGAGTELDHVFAIGGGARSDVWVQIIADATGVALEIPKAGEIGAAFGAARLGMCASEGADPGEVCTRPGVERVVEPNPAMADHHARALTTYRALYPATRACM